MGDPRRLLSATSDADALERALLESLHATDPAQDAQAEMWRGIATNLAAASLLAAAPLAASSATAAVSTAPLGAGAKVATSLTTLIGKSLLTKVVVVAVAASSASVLGVLALQRPRAVAPHAASTGQPRVPRPVAPTQGSSVPVSPPVEAVRAGATPCCAPGLAQADCAGPACPAPAAAREPTRHAARDTLLGESKLLSAARADFVRGDLRGAQRALDRLVRTYPRGVLVQEREVLRIDVLFANGKVEQARRRARAFVAAHPGSPHAAALRNILEGP